MEESKQVTHAEIFHIIFVYTLPSGGGAKLIGGYAGITKQESMAWKSNFTVEKSGICLDQ